MKSMIASPESDEFDLVVKEEGAEFVSVVKKLLR